MEERVTFVSDGLKLTGVLHVPDRRGPRERRPAFLVLHGFGSNKDSGGSVATAKMFTSFGYAALRFDMRGCGESEGVRGRVICLEQVEDTRSALTFLAARPEIDPDRIGAMGASFGAAVAVYTAGVDQRVAACVSAGGWGDGEKKFRKQHESPEAWKRFAAMLESARAGAAAAAPTADALRRFTRDVFVRAGMSEVDAATVADVLVWADLRGVDSHGVSRISMYLRLIDDGDLNVRPAIEIGTETAASVLVDADRAAGPSAMTMAMGAAVRKARDAGVGLALVRATTHTAALGYYTLMAAQEGMAAIALAASGPFMAYHGTRAAGVSTNPS